MPTNRATVIFTGAPVIGHTYTLTHWVNQDPQRAILVDLVEKVDDYGQLPSGGHVRQANTYAIFQCCETQRRFKRIVVPELI